MHFASLREVEECKGSLTSLEGRTALFSPNNTRMGRFCAPDTPAICRFFLRPEPQQLRIAVRQGRSHAMVTCNFTLYVPRLSPYAGPAFCKLVRHFVPADIQFHSLVLSSQAHDILRDTQWVIWLFDKPDSGQHFHEAFES